MKRADLLINLRLPSSDCLVKRWLPYACLPLASQYLSRHVQQVSSCELSIKKPHNTIVITVRMLRLRQLNLLGHHEHFYHLAHCTTIAISEQRVDLSGVALVSCFQLLPIWEHSVKLSLYAVNLGFKWVRIFLHVIKSPVNSFLTCSNLLHKLS